MPLGVTCVLYKGLQRLGGQLRPKHLAARSVPCAVAAPRSESRAGIHFGQIAGDDTKGGTPGRVWTLGSDAVSADDPLRLRASYLEMHARSRARRGCRRARGNKRSVATAAGAHAAPQEAVHHVRGSPIDGIIEMASIIPSSSLKNMSRAPGRFVRHQRSMISTSCAARRFEKDRERRRHCHGCRRRRAKRIAADSFGAASAARMRSVSSRISSSARSNGSASPPVKTITSAPSGSRVGLDIISARPNREQQERAHPNAQWYWRLRKICTP